MEIFHLGEDDLLPAEAFLHELCTDLAFGQGPAPRAAVETSAGARLHARALGGGARRTCFGVPLDTFEGHEGLFLTVVVAEGRHNVAELLRPYRDRFEQEPTERRPRPSREQARRAAARRSRRASSARA